MVMDEVISQLIEECPVAVMARLGLEHALNEDWVNAIFEQNRERQYTRELLFSTVVDLMSVVAMGVRPSLNAAVQKYGKKLPVSLVSLYGKVNHTETNVIRALVQGSSERLAAVRGELDTKKARMLEGYRIRIVDGNHLSASEKRLSELRGFRGAALPGHSLVVFDPDIDMAIDMVPCEDAHTQERALLGDVLGKARAGELYMGDRNICTRAGMILVSDRAAAFLFREHGVTNPVPAGKRVEIGRIETGVVYEQPVDVPKADGTYLRVRRIVLELDAPTTDGETIIVLLTNLPTSIAALDIARLYRGRWSIEGMFGRLEAALNNEIPALGHPPAALLAFGCSIIAFNVLALIEAAIAATQDLKSAGVQLSTYYVADDVKYGYSAVKVMLPALTSVWSTLGTESPAAFAENLRQIAAHVRVQTLRKHPRGPKKQKKKGYAPKGAVQKHVSTARVLRDGGIK